MTAAKSFIARLLVKPEKRADFIALQTELKALAFQHEPGLLVYELLQDDNNENLFHCVSTFKDEAAFDHHMHIDFHERLVPPIIACLAEDMTLSFHRSLS
jgi:quinol monooxygenase YgiN